MNVRRVTRHRIPGSGQERFGGSLWVNRPTSKRKPRGTTASAPLVAQFGGIPLKRKRQAILVDQQPQRYRADRKELIKRLLADEYELCGSTVDVEVHRVRALRALNVKGRGAKSLWIQVMAARRRKTLVVCRPCHLNVHGGDWQPCQQKVGSVPTVVS